MGKASDDVAGTARQLRWAALAALVLGVVIAAVGYAPLGAVIAAAGFVTYVAMQYLGGRYGG